MDIDQFLEKDILSFLDGKIENKHKGAVDREEEYGLYLTKDYMKELTASLDNDELTKAKRLFDELKQTYNNLPKNSLERKKIYNLLEQMYAKIEAYVKMRTRSGSGESIPLVISQIVGSKEKGHVNKLDMQSSIIENQLENLDKKFSKEFSNVENQVSELKNEFTGLDFTEKLGESAASSNRNILSESMNKKAERKLWKDELGELSLDNLGKNVAGYHDIDKLRIKKADDHKDKSKDKPIEIFKIPKKTAKDTLKKQKILNDSKDFKDSLYNVQEKMSHEDIKSSEFIERMSLPTNKTFDQKEPVHVYKIPHTTDEQKSEKKTKEEPHSEESFENKKIESYMIIKEQKSEPSHKPSISVEDEAKYLEGFEHVERIYFEGIYLFYNHNYQEASKLFEKVLSSRPKSKAAKIRLHECMEAIESG